MPVQAPIDPCFRPANVADLLSEAASRSPDHAAIAQPLGRGWKSISFGELDAECDRLASGLRRQGVEPGTRIALLVPAGIEFVKSVFALFRCGAVAVLIDPGMGRRNLIECLSEAQPQGFLGVRKAHLARWLYRNRFPSARLNFLVGSRYFPGCVSVQTLAPPTAGESQRLIDAARDPNQPAAIIFTTGSTGVPKGVQFSHFNFLRQAQEIRNYFQIESGGADISGFPLFALFNTSLVKTTVFPRMDFTQPAKIDPQNFIDAIEHWQASQAFGSPALLNAVSRYCERRQIRLTRLRRVLSAGAPVPVHVLRRMRKIIHPLGDVYTPYGATEALPVACNNATIVLSETSEKTNRGAGVCVGCRFPGIEWQVIRITDEPLQTIEQIEPLPKGEIGELIVAGDVVTRRYVTRPECNALAKIEDGDRIWHRMGDVGYVDERDRFWMCGRKSHRVVAEQGTLFTVPCESIVNTHPAIYRSALVGVGQPGHQIPVIVAEPWAEHWPRARGKGHHSRDQRLIRELQGLLSQHDVTKRIQYVLLRRELPTDIRHNSKIFREQLVDWTAARLPK